MLTITTARILADKALQNTCGKECVDWAVSILEQGHNGQCLSILAGISPPFNHFELADYRDRALRELGIADVGDPNAAVSTLAAEHLRYALVGGEDLISTLRTIKGLCIANYYQKDIYDFYTLFFAYDDLQHSDEQWYWQGATRQNIISIIRRRAEEFLQSTDPI